MQQHRCLVFVGIYLALSAAGGLRTDLPLLRHSRSCGLTGGGMGPGAPRFARVHSGSNMGKLSLAHATHNFKCVGVLIHEVEFGFQVADGDLNLLDHGLNEGPLRKVFTGYAR